MTSDSDNESLDLFVFVDELRKEISMKCSKLKSNLEAKVELDSRRIPAAEQQHPPTSFILLEDEPNSPPPSTSFDKFVTESSSESDEYEIEEGEYVSSPEKKKDDVRNISEFESLSEFEQEESDEFEIEDEEYFSSPEKEKHKDEVRNISESSSEVEEEEEEDTEYFPVTKEAVTKPSRRQNADKAVPRRGRGRPPLNSGNDKLDQTTSSVFNSRTRKFNCKTCQKPFKTRALATAHNKAVHLKVRHGCELCGVTCSSLDHLNRHKKSKHGENSSLSVEIETEDLSPSAEEQDAAATTNASTQQKQRTEERKEFFTFDSETKKYKCIDCQFKSSRRQGAVRHYEAVHLQKEYECDICGATVSRPDYLARHKLKVHPPGLPNKAPRRKLGAKGPVPKAILNPETGKYRCRECSKEFATQSTVYAHFEASHSGNIYKCDICNVVECKLLSNFKAHQKLCQNSLQKRSADKQSREADPNYKFPCAICEKRFKTISVLNEHIQETHTSERNHVCDICQKRFTSLDRLKKHKKCVHSGRRFCCKVCNKIYRSRSAYRNHEKMCVKKNPDHPSVLKDKPNKAREKETVSKEEMFIFNSETGTFDCSVCQKPCKSEKSARLHYGSVHQQNSFLCELCGKSYAHQNNFDMHKKQCSGEKPEVVNKATLSPNLQTEKRLDEMKRKEGDQRKCPFRLVLVE